MKGLLLRSKENGVPLLMIYMDSRGEVTERWMKVLDMDEQYIKAYCCWKRQYRTFKLSHILSVGTAKYRKRGA
ncbi:WYL domain-containing protein [Bacillus xiapuensis]|uniref:hypothetical protein n=1 Tax=Bacillus xiapuensis TaxID=2014075 RepID=UPI000C23683D|nr:hypothetical protein [Bacillus xiapuensis]